MPENLTMTMGGKENEMTKCRANVVKHSCDEHSDSDALHGVPQRVKGQSTASKAGFRLHCGYGRSGKSEIYPNHFLWRPTSPVGMETPSQANATELCSQSTFCRSSGL